jgi:D-alanyl-D-alanine carboxypeptidase (penicillin-binding protein 5/6)
MMTGPAAAFAVIRPPELRPPIPIAEYRRPPDVSAASWIVFDAIDGVILGSRNPDVIRPMASTTKIMTALLALEQSSPDQVVLVSENAAQAGEAEIDLFDGEQLLMEDLITTMVVRSANDSAIAVAEAIGGDTATFVALMNRRAEELGLIRTFFVNPHGLDADGHASTARDLLRLGLAAMANPEFRRMASLREFDLGPTPDGTPRIAKSTNGLLDIYPGAIGVKTGFTFQAGLVLVAAAERDGRTVYAVVMGSEGSGAHFSDASALLDYGFEGNELVRAVAGESVSVGSLLRRTARLESQFHVASLGSVSQTSGGAEVQTPEPVEELPTLFDAMMWWFGGGSDG